MSKNKIEPKNVRPQLSSESSERLERTVSDFVRFLIIHTFRNLVAAAQRRPQRKSVVHSVGKSQIFPQGKASAEQPTDEVQLAAASVLYSSLCKLYFILTLSIKNKTAITALYAAMAVTINYLLLCSLYSEQFISPRRAR